MPRSRYLSALMLAALVALSSLVAPVAGSARAQVADFAAAGLVSETGYVSPHHDYEITWDAAWVVDPDRVDPVLWDKLDIDQQQAIPVFTRDDGTYDRLDIWLPEHGARLRVIGQAVGNGVGVHLPSMGSVNNALGGVAEHLLEIDDPEESVVVHRHAMNDGSILLSYNELVPGAGNDFWLWIQLVAPEAEFAEAFGRAEADVESDAFAFGGPVTAAEILDASAAEPVVPVSEYGITSATGWQVPAWDIEVEWDSSFTTFENLNAIRHSEESFWLYLGPKSGERVRIEVSVFGNRDRSSLEDLLAQTVGAMEAQDNDVLIAAVEGERAIILSRSLANGEVFVEYTEIGLSADGEAIVWIDFRAPLAGYGFVTRLGLAFEAVSVDGVPFAATYRTFWLVAAANAPFTA